MFGLGVLGELCASRFRGPKRIRAKGAKGAKDAKVRKATAGLSFDYMGWRACGVAGVTGLSEPGYNGGRWRGGVLAGGGIKGMFLFCACKLIRLDASGLGVLGELCASRFPGPKRVRAKNAKDAKVRKAIAGLSFDHMGWRACGGGGGFRAR